MFCVAAIIVSAPPQVTESDNVNSGIVLHKTVTLTESEALHPAESCTSTDKL